MASSLYPRGALRQGKPLPPGRYVLLYSGGLDSTYLLMLLSGGEGVEVVPLHAYISRSIYNVALENLRRVKGGGSTLYLVLNHADLLRIARRRLAEMGLLEYTCLACKALMLLEASRLAGMIGARGIVTGETLGQVASQTLANMQVIHRYAEHPVYTPLLSLDKHEASNLIAGMVGKTPDCPFLPKRRVTRADYHVATLVLEEVGVRELAELAIYERVSI